MPRPNDKASLLLKAQENFKKLLHFINSLDDNQQNGTFNTDTLNQNISDVLCHLYAWHLMVQNWVSLGCDPTNVQEPQIPAEGFTWRMVPELNVSINHNYKGTIISDAINLCQSSHNACMELIESFTNEELFTKKKYKWTGSTSLGAYLISATSSHYNWAYKLIKKGVESM